MEQTSKTGGSAAAEPTIDTEAVAPKMPSCPKAGTEGDSEVSPVCGDWADAGKGKGPSENVVTGQQQAAALGRLRNRCP